MVSSLLSTDFLQSAEQFSLRVSEQLGFCVAARLGLRLWMPGATCGNF